MEGTDRISLHLLERGDCRAITEWNAGKDRDFLIQWAGDKVYTHPLTAEQIRIRLPEEDSLFFKAERFGEMIGTVELSQIDREAATAKVCRFLLREDCRGGGIGRQFLQLLSDYAFVVLGLTRLTLGVFAFNEPAIRCYEKAGFIKERFHERENPRWNAWTMVKIPNGKSVSGRQPIRDPYKKMLDYVAGRLGGRNILAARSGPVPFRRRSEHIRRVLMWAERIAEDLPVNKEILFTAAAFHDAGYAESIENHAHNSARICEAYLQENAYPEDFIRQVVSLVENHSRKELLNTTGTPPELILLMEADLLDEAGALGIVWDCMCEGNDSVQDFCKTYGHIVRYSGDMLKANPMVTKKAMRYWTGKQELIRSFIHHLAYDLGLDAPEI